MVLSLAWFSPAAHSALLVFKLGGTIDFVDAARASWINVGDSWSAELFIDSGSPDVHTSSRIGAYLNPTGFYQVGDSYRIDVGSFTQDLPLVTNTVSIHDSPVGFNSTEGVAFFTQDVVGTTLTPDGTRLESVGANVFGLSDTIPVLFSSTDLTEALGKDILDFGYAQAFGIRVYDQFGQRRSIARGTVDSFSAAFMTVPEPRSLASLLLGLCVIAITRGISWLPPRGRRISTMHGATDLLRDLRY